MTTINFDKQSCKNCLLLEDRPQFFFCLKHGLTVFNPDAAGCEHRFTEANRPLDHPPEPFNLDWALSKAGFNLEGGGF